jgi:serine/threonine-protein kinase
MEVCAQHLHASPIPPSERLGRALPQDLERLLLACLAKKPEQRPADARALRKALLGCSVPKWTPERAEAWWVEHGVHARRQPADTTARVDRDTVAIDLDARAAG